MKVKEIEERLSNLDEDLELQHVWTEKTKNKEKGMIDFKTTLFFQGTGIKSQIEVKHSRKINKDEDDKKDKNLTQKLGSFLK